MEINSDKSRLTEKQLTQHLYYSDSRIKRFS